MSEKRENSLEQEKALEATEQIMEKPSLEVIASVLEEEEKRQEHAKNVRTVLYSMLVVAALAVLVVIMVFPILKIDGTSMSNTLMNGDVVVSAKAAKVQRGDVIAFYYNNKVLVKRVIATSGDWVDVDEEGNVFVNGMEIDEPYISEKAYGECDISLPYQVPEGKLFVMGDKRATSIDSRNSSIGTISDEMIVGKLFLRIWPLFHMKLL